MDGFVYVNSNKVGGEYSDDEKKEAEKLLKTVDKYVATLVRGFTKKAVESVENNEKLFYLTKFENENDTFENIPIMDIAKNKWQKLARKYYPIEKCKDLEKKIEKLIKNDRYNNGIDPITGHPYKISVFTYKTDKSKFKNGIIISRDGIKYT